jgi:hypothetical protein
VREGLIAYFRAYYWPWDALEATGLAE